MNGLAALAVLLLGACTPGDPGKEAKFWTVREFLKGQEKVPQRDFGGWLPSELLAREGAQLRFHGTTQASKAGLTIFPAVADGAATSFVITDIWADHPEPWVQPVWIPQDESGTRPEGVSVIFPVDVDSTFYSPFWRAEFFTSPVVTPMTYRSARQVLAATGERRSGAIILCPIVPADVGFADDGSGPKNPSTLQPVEVPSMPGAAWVDEEKVFYFNFGPDRAQADVTGQDLIEVPAYFFVTSAGGKPLPLAAVLSADAKRHSLARRVDVVLPVGAAPFVPSNRDALRKMLQALDPPIPVPLPPPERDAFPEFTLRVAGRPSCFTELTFPANCDWLDSPARLRQLPVDQLIERKVQMAIAVMQ